MAINQEVPSASPLTDETDFASEQGATFDALREAYEAAQAKLLNLIDGPDKGLHFSEYRKQLNAALQEQQEAHGAMMAAWQAPRIMLGVPDETDWKAIAAAHVPIMVHTCDSEAYAAAWNDGYESAVTQGLADDPTLADDWFQEKIRAARAQALEDTAKEMREERHGWCLDDAGRYWIKRTLDELAERAGVERGKE